MSQPPWTPPTGGGTGDPDPAASGGPEDAAYRGAHSSGDESSTPPDDLWGGPGTPGPWSGGADQPWAASSSTDPWAGAKGGWATGSGPDDSGPAFPVPGAAPAPGAGAGAGAGLGAPEPARRPAADPAPQPWAAGAAPEGPPNHAGAGYGPPSYADPTAPSAGPAVGEPAFGPGAGYATPGQLGQPGPLQPGHPQPGQTPPDQPQPGEPFRSVRPDAVPPSAGAPPAAAPAVGGFGAPDRDLVRDDRDLGGRDAVPAPSQPPPSQQPPSQQPPLSQPLQPAPWDAGPSATPSAPAPWDSGPAVGRPAPGPWDTGTHDLGAGPGPSGGPPAAAAPSEPPRAPAAEVYTPDPPPTLRPPQPQLPESMSEVPQYAARLAPAPLPDGTPGTAPGLDQSAAPAAPSGWGGPPPGDPGGPAPAPAGWPQQGGPAHAVGGTPPPPAIPRPEDLLVSSRPRQLEKPATWGWRGRLARWSGGAFKPKPSPAELADRQAKLNAQRGFSRPMTVVVIQPKGGAGKTPTTICVASALGVRRGGYIVGWDNNETRGTLAVRTTNDDNQRTTAWDLLGRLDEFERSEARVGDLGYYMRAQGDAQFDALVSDDNPGNMAQIGEVEFRRIHQVLQRFYRMIIIDTGNNVRSTNWQAAVDHADQIVVVSTYQRDVAYSGSWVLDHLAQTGRDELARDAITVLTAAEAAVDQVVQGELVKHFTARTRAVVEVPYDPHIAEGGPIRWSELSDGSQRAWTSVAAAITQTLYDRDQRQLAARGRPGG